MGSAPLHTSTPPPAAVNDWAGWLAAWPRVSLHRVRNALSRVGSVRVGSRRFVSVHVGSGRELSAVGMRWRRAAVHELLRVVRVVSAGL